MFYTDLPEGKLEASSVGNHATQLLDGRTASRPKALDTLDAPDVVPEVDASMSLPADGTRMLWPETPYGWGPTPQANATFQSVSSQPTAWSQNPSPLASPIVDVQHAMWPQTQQANHVASAGQAYHAAWSPLPEQQQFTWHHQSLQQQEDAQKQAWAFELQRKKAAAEQALVRQQAWAQEMQRKHLAGYPQQPGAPQASGALPGGGVANVQPHAPQALVGASVPSTAVVPVASASTLLGPAGFDTGRPQGGATLQPEAAAPVSQPHVDGVESEDSQRHQDGGEKQHRRSRRRRGGAKRSRAKNRERKEEEADQPAADASVQQSRSSGQPEVGSRRDVERHSKEVPREPAVSEEHVKRSAGKPSLSEKAQPVQEPARVGARMGRMGPRGELKKEAEEAPASTASSRQQRRRGNDQQGKSTVGAPSSPGASKGKAGDSRKGNASRTAGSKSGKGRGW